MMTAADIMRRAAPAVDGAERLGRAARLMRATRLGHVPVTRRGRLVGMLDEHRTAAAHPSLATTLTVGEIPEMLDRVRVRELMSGDVAAVGPGTPLGEAIRLMRARSLTALPVVVGDRLLGLLTREDLLALLETLLRREMDGGAGADPGRPVAPGEGRAVWLSRRWAGGQA
jgi:CBS domain-containing protein